MTFKMTLNLKFEDVIRNYLLEYTSVDQKNIFCSINIRCLPNFLKGFFFSFGWSTMVNVAQGGSIVGTRKEHLVSLHCKLGECCKRRIYSWD